MHQSKAFRSSLWSVCIPAVLSGAHLLMAQGAFKKNRFVLRSWALVSALIWNLTVNILASNIA